MGLHCCFPVRFSIELLQAYDGGMFAVRMHQAFSVAWLCLDLDATDFHPFSDGSSSASSSKRFLYIEI